MDKRSPRGHLWTILAVLSLVIAGVCWKLFLSTVHKQVEIDGLNLGAVWSQRDFVTQLTIKNPTSEAVKLSGFSPYKVEPDSFILNPGQTKQVTATMNLRGYSVTSDFSAYTLSSELTATMKWPSEEEIGHWPMTGLVRRPFKLSSTKSFFAGPNSPIEGQSAQGVLSLTPWVELSDVQVRIKNVKGITGTARAPKSRGEDWLIKLVSSPDLKAGPFEGELCLEATTQTGEKLSAVSAIIQGKVRPSVFSTPSSVSWLNVHSKENKPVVLTLHATEHKVSLRSVEASEKWLKAEQWTTDSQGNPRLLVRVVGPEVTGDFKAYLTIHSVDEKSQRHETVVPVFGYIKQ